MAAIEILVAGEHVHRAALAARIAADPAGEFGHDAARVHPAGQHVAMVAVGRDDGVDSSVAARAPTTTASCPM